MKFCAYCGKENQESAALCAECGTDEFTATARVAPKRWFTVGVRMKKSTSAGVVLGLSSALALHGLFEKDYWQAVLHGIVALLSLRILVQERRRNQASASTSPSKPKENASDAA